MRSNLILRISSALILSLAICSFSLAKGETIPPFLTHENLEDIGVVDLESNETPLQFGGLFWLCFDTHSAKLKVKCEDPTYSEGEGYKVIFSLEIRLRKLVHYFDHRHAILLSECRELERDMKREMKRSSKACVKAVPFFHPPQKETYEWTFFGFKTSKVDLE